MSRGFSLLFVLFVFTAGAIFGSSFTVRAQQPSAQQSMQQMLAEKTAALGACNTELGPLQGMMARIISGELFTMAQARAAYEKANAGLTITAAWVSTALSPAKPSPVLSGKPEQK